ncbi:hypothetical protein BC827DRAFT_769167 [Russula dissimulans]|nr:hypothetical protein BC827DRAFT_769167 [Russula dissimulans]
MWVCPASAASLTNAWSTLIGRTTVVEKPRRRAYNYTAYVGKRNEFKSPKRACCTKGGEMTSPNRYFTAVCLPGGRGPKEHSVEHHLGDDTYSTIWHFPRYALLTLSLSRAHPGVRSPSSSRYWRFRSNSAQSPFKSRSSNVLFYLQQGLTLAKVSASSLQRKPCLLGEWAHAEFGSQILCAPFPIPPPCQGPHLSGWPVKTPQTNKQKHHFHCVCGSPLRTAFFIGD